MLGDSFVLFVVLILGDSERRGPKVREVLFVERQILEVIIQLGHNGGLLYYNRDLAPQVEARLREVDAADHRRSLIQQNHSAMAYQAVDDAAISNNLYRDVLPLLVREQCKDLRVGDAMIHDARMLEDAFESI